MHSELTAGNLRTTEEFGQLKVNYESLNMAPTATEADKWLKICKTPKLFKGVENILFFALACFVKSPLEATAESVASVINQHGRLDRYSLLPLSLSDEVRVAWNAPPFPSPTATDIIKTAVERYFAKHKSGPRFYVTSKLKLMSSTVAAFLKRPAKIEF